MRRMLSTTLPTLLLHVLCLVPPAAAQVEVVEYYHHDALGSVRAVTNAAGEVVSQHDYLPFGEEWQAPLSPTPLLQFTGKERDRETGLDYFGARYYASRTGRFTTVDPGHVGGNIFDPQSWNAYAYARNNPLKYVDPTGTDYIIAVEGGEPFWFDQGFGDYGALDRYLSGQGFRPLGSSDSGYILNAAGQIVGEYSYFSRSARVFGGAGLLASRWLNEQLTDMAVGTAIAATGGLAAGAFSGGLATSEVLGIGRIAVGVRPSPGQIAQMQQVFARQGRAGVEKALRSLEQRLAEHLSKIDAARGAGGYTSSMEREVANFRQLIAAARQVLGK